MIQISLVQSIYTFSKATKFGNYENYIVIFYLSNHQKSLSISKTGLPDDKIYFRLFPFLGFPLCTVEMCLLQFFFCRLWKGQKLHLNTFTTLLFSSRSYPSIAISELFRSKKFSEMFFRDRGQGSNPRGDDFGYFGDHFFGAEGGKKWKFSEILGKIWNIKLGQTFFRYFLHHQS